MDREHSRTNPRFLAHGPDRRPAAGRARSANPRPGGRGWTENRYAPARQRAGKDEKRRRGRI